MGTPGAAFRRSFLLWGAMLAGGQLVVRGTTSDNGTVRRVTVNGREARAVAPNHAQWEAVLDGVGPGEVRLVAGGEDAAGNVERLPHTVVVPAAGR